MDSEYFQCTVLYFVDESVKTLVPFDPSFWNCKQCEVFEFSPLSELPTVLHLLLARSDTDAVQFRKTLQAYSAALFVASMTASCVNKAQESSNLNPTMTIERNLFHYIRASITSHPIKQ